MVHVYFRMTHDYKRMMHPNMVCCTYENIVCTVLIYRMPVLNKTYALHIPYAGYLCKPYVITTAILKNVCSIRNNDCHTIKRMHYIYVTWGDKQPCVR